MQTKLEATEQELSETQEAFENLKVTAIEIEQQRDASLTECQTKTIMYTELEEKVVRSAFVLRRILHKSNICTRVQKILEEQSERMQASTQSVLSSKDGKSAKDAEFEEQLRLLHVQRMDDFKSFEHKLLAKSNQLAQAQIELASSISEVRF
jgi:hypothetical protein